MPKDTSRKHSGRVLKEKQPVASTSTRKTSKSKKSSETVPAAALDESTWRSHVPVGQRINKTKALTEYRLKAENLKDLQSEASETAVRINGEDRRMPMVLYSERDVEREAWRKHGGPEGWKAYLEKLKLRHVEAGRTNPFVAPTDYSAGPSVSIMSLPASQRQSVHPWNATPDLLRMKPSFPSWLWKKCHQHLDHSEAQEYIFMSGLSPRDREDRIRVALQRLPGYPARPESTLPSSPSVDRLRQVLREAPSVVAYQRHTGPSKYEGIEWHEDGPSGETTYHWSDFYLEKLFGALIEVIEAHRIGEDGWGTARWEVYDKYSECIEGLTYFAASRDGPATWLDNAHDWLLAKVDRGVHYLSTRRNEYSDIGKRYNSLLPSTVPLRRLGH